MEGSKLAADIKFFLDYSKWMKDENRSETWEDSVTRVMDMHRNNPKIKPAFENEYFKKAFEKAEQLYLEKRVLGSNRALQFGGDPIMKHNSKMYNCLASHTNRVEFFGEAMYWLMNGCGIGYSVQYRHINMLPSVGPRNLGTKTFVIPDSVEGWSDAVGVLVSSFFFTQENKAYQPEYSRFHEYSGYQVKFDYSQIRIKGAEITGGFKAPGPDGLKRTLERIEELLTAKVRSEGASRLKPIEAYDIVCHMSDAVLSGGVRRSASICIFSPEDDEMIEAKTFANFNPMMGVNPQRARSNNSAILLRDKTTKKQFTDILKKTEEWGEPGFYWVDHLDQVPNPCVTKDAWIMTEDGPQQVKDLIDKPFKVWVNGKLYSSTAKGFFYTGDKKVYRIETEFGGYVDATDNHKFLIKNADSKEEWVELKDLKLEDRLILNNNREAHWAKGKESDFEKGWLIGSLIGDGSLSEKTAKLAYWGEEREQQLDQAVSYLQRNFNNKKGVVGSNPSSFGSYQTPISVENVELKRYAYSLGLTQTNKTSTPQIEKSNMSFYKGYLRGLFDADGYVYGDKRMGYYVCLSNTDKELLESTRRMLLRLGINSKIYLVHKEGKTLLPTWKGEETKEYSTKDCFDLRISKDNIYRFVDLIGFSQESKQLKLESYISTLTRGFYKESFLGKVKSIQLVSESEDVYDCTIDEVHRFDANGFVAHNCVEIGMWPITEDGRSGWQGCNLAVGNGKLVTSKEEFFEMCKGLALMGTMQATYTDFRYVGEESKQIFEREALLGCGISGWMNSPDILLDEQTMREGAQLILEENAKLAKILGINPAARTTCVKPDGNTGVLLQSTSGVHGEEAPQYFRLIQIEKQSEIATYLKENYPDLIEESVWSSSQSDYVVYVPIVAKKDSILKRDLIGVNQLKAVQSIQQNWVEYGTRLEACVKPFLRHNVSNTVQVEDWKEVGEYLYENRQYFSGVSFLGVFGSLDYKQAPFTPVIMPDELLEKYGHAVIFASGLIVDGLNAFDDDLWEALMMVNHNGTKVEGTRTAILLKKDWIRRAKQFAKRYFKNDFLEMSYCLKQVFLYHKWVTVNRSLQKKIDLSKVILKPHYIEMDTMGSASCQGGACELPGQFLDQVADK